MKHDLKEILDSADAEKIAEDYKAVDSKTSRRMFSNYLKKVENANNQFCETTENTEIYKVEKKHIVRSISAFTAYAGALSLIIVLGVTFFAMHSFRRPVPPASNTPEPSSETTITEPTKLEIINPPILSELEIHVDPPPVYSMDEVDAIVKNGTMAYKQKGKTLIATESYISQLERNDFASDSIELKSYIYHMMLNSIDYFNSAEGEMIYADNISVPITIKFQTDISNKLSYEIESQYGSPVEEIYHSDNMSYTVNCETQKYTENRCAEKFDLTVSDNERVITLDDGKGMSLFRPNSTNLGIPGNSCLLPQALAMSFLSDFSNWELGETSDFLGRSCVNINGTCNRGKFSMIIDIKTGVLLKYESYSTSGEVKGFIEVNSIRIDNNINVKEFDKSKFEKEDESTKNKYAVNSKGQTYGNADSEFSNDLPDLVSVVGDNGYKGYVYSFELFSNKPATPSEALKIQEAKDNGTYVPKILNVYESDGTTIIDTFTEDLN